MTKKTNDSQPKYDGPKSYRCDYCGWEGKEDPNGRCPSCEEAGRHGYYCDHCMWRGEEPSTDQCPECEAWGRLHPVHIFPQYDRR